jgi:hypothetical protein
VAPPPASDPHDPGPVRTPAPVRIDPIQAYQGSLDGFIGAVGFQCDDKFHFRDCMTVVPSTRQDGVTIEPTCTVLGSDPDLHEGLAIDPEKVPVIVSVDVRCDDGSL